MSVVVSRREPPGAVIHRTFRAVAHVVSTRHADATMLLDLRRGLRYSLNELGWRIWDQIGAGESIPTVVRTLRQEYDLPLETFEADVAAFVDHLVSASLIEPAEY